MKMKKIALDIVVAIIFMALSSCHQMMDGLGDPFMLSKKTIAIPPEGGVETVTILQKKQAWINGVTYWDNVNNKDEKQSISGEAIEKVITHDWFSIWLKFEDGYEVIYVQLTPNDTGFKRRVSVGLQSMNVFDGFEVYQDPL